jgi:hypothetical protein
VTSPDEVAREALARVVGGPVVAGMRGDSPLPLAGGDLVALADAVATAAPGVLLGDDDLAGVSTLDGLVAAIAAHVDGGRP